MNDRILSEPPLRYVDGEQNKIVYTSRYGNTKHRVTLTLVVPRFVTGEMRVAVDVHGSIL